MSPSFPPAATVNRPTTTAATRCCSKLQVILIDTFPGATVTCDNGVAKVRVDTAFSQQEKTANRIIELAGGVSGIDDAHVEAVPVAIDEQRMYPAALAAYGCSTEPIGASVWRSFH